MSRCGFAALLALSLSAGVAGGAALPDVPLPPLAKPGSPANGDSSWLQSGEISGSVALVRGEFAAALARGGWVLDKSIGLGRGTGASGLTLWRREGTKILLMIWEIRVGVCGFSWGLA